MIFRIRGIAKWTRRARKFARVQRVYNRGSRLERPRAAAGTLSASSQLCVRSRARCTCAAHDGEVTTPLVIGTRDTRGTTESAPRPLCRFRPAEFHPRRHLFARRHLLRSCSERRFSKIGIHRGRPSSWNNSRSTWDTRESNESEIKAGRCNYRFVFHYTFSTFNNDSYLDNYAELSAIAPTICN